MSDVTEADKTGRPVSERWTLPGWLGAAVLVILLSRVFMAGLGYWPRSGMEEYVIMAAGPAIVAAALTYCSFFASRQVCAIIGMVAGAGAILTLCFLTAILVTHTVSNPIAIQPPGGGETSVSLGELACLSLLFLALVALYRYGIDPAGSNYVSDCGAAARLKNAAGIGACEIGFAVAFFSSLMSFYDGQELGKAPLAPAMPLEVALSFTVLFAVIALGRKNVSLHTMGVFIRGGMLVPLVATAVHLAVENRISGLQNAVDRLADLAGGLTIQPQELFENVRAVLSTVARAPEITASAGECNAYVAQPVLFETRLHAILVAAPDGRVICSSQPQYLGANIGGLHQLELARESFAVTDAVAGITGKLYVAEAAFAASGGTSAPLVIALVDPAALSASMQSAALPAGVEAIFADGAGKLIVHMTGDPGNTGGSFAGRAWMRPALGAERAVYEAAGERGIARYYASRKLANGAGIVITSKSRDAVASELDRDFERHILVTAIITALMLLVGHVTAEWLMFAPLRRLSHFARRVETGDLSTRLDVRPVGEVGGIFRILDHMTNSLAEREAHLLATRALFESVFNHSRDCIYISKMRGNGDIYVDVCNDAGAAGVHLPVEQVGGKTFHDLLSAECASLITRDLRLVMGRGVPMEFEYHQEDTDQFWEGVHFPLAGADGKVDSVFTSLTETTERRRVDRMKSEFIATVSHELRTPLTSIAGALGLILGGTAGYSGDKAAKLLKIAHENALRLVRLVNDILDIEKIEAGRMELDIKPVDLRTSVENAISSLAAYAQEYGVTVVFETNGLKPRVEADEDRLAQVVTNVVSNAIKFSPRGETVTVALKASGRRGLIRLTVSDHGPGIPLAFQPRIFAKFSQADNSDTRTKGGTGLGLSICKEIMERLGGRILFESVEGEGTSFHIDVPVAAAAGPAIQYGEAV